MSGKQQGNYNRNLVSVALSIIRRLRANSGWRGGQPGAGNPFLASPRPHGEATKSRRGLGVAHWARNVYASAGETSAGAAGLFGRRSIFKAGGKKVPFLMLHRSNTKLLISRLRHLCLRCGIGSIHANRKFMEIKRSGLFSSFVIASQTKSEVREVHEIYGSMATRQSCVGI